MANIISIPSLQDLVLAEQITDYINPNDLFNYFVNTPDNERILDPYEEFVNLCRKNLGWAVRHLIGKGTYELFPFQLAIMDILWDKTFPLLLMTRGGGKTSLLAVYSILRAVLDQNSQNGSKIVLVAASFRQSKIVMEYCESLWKISPLLQACCDNPNGIKRDNDKWEMTFGKSTIIALPLGDGSRIRGIRASHVVVDEYASVPPDVFEVVVRGFAAVNTNPVEKVRAIYRRDKMLKMGLKEEEIPEPPKGNQIVRSGTASYEFNHFYSVYEQYLKIIKNKLCGFGNEPQIQAVLGNSIPSDTFVDYKKYAVIQIPYIGLPRGYMDETMISEASIRMSKDEFNMEYNAKFIRDSYGFFKASAIEMATPKVNDADYFELELEGYKGYSYVMGLDPARKSDRFALVILKIVSNGYRLVYLEQWEKKNFGIIAKQIRKLVKAFDIKRIGIDQGGGGTAIVDFLQTPELIPMGEVPFWGVDEQTNVPGLKILHLINYMGQWLKGANYDLSADIEHKRLLFPRTALVNAKESIDGEEIFALVTECKKQLTKIEISVTEKTEVEHFDLPGDIKWKEYKDLYSALLIAAYEARELKGHNVRAITMSGDSIGGSIDEFYRMES